MNGSALSAIQVIIAPLVYIVGFLGIPVLLALPSYFILKRFIRNKVILRIVVFLIFLFMLIIFLSTGFRGPINRSGNNPGISETQNNIRQKGE